MKDPVVVQDEHPAVVPDLEGHRPVPGLEAGIGLSKEIAHRQNGQDGLFSKIVLADHLHRSLQHHPHEGLSSRGGLDELSLPGRNLPGRQALEHGRQVIRVDLAKEGALRHQLFCIHTGRLLSLSPV